ncbi:hypothetical protein CEXT_388641 [Caerostris extrusa]|uniref:Uncharacterized protein n=1 Tax=Caerostris extrusa TaxID=172846 RepID=A0AAV4T7W5_CAEEX|nr:hypothetical protein CEXT_388641 [Caerostris extrusa]
MDHFCPHVVTNAVPTVTLQADNVSRVVRVTSVVKKKKKKKKMAIEIRSLSLPAGCTCHATDKPSGKEVGIVRVLTHSLSSSLGKPGSELETHLLRTHHF